MAVGAISSLSVSTLSSWSAKSSQEREGGGTFSLGRVASQAQSVVVSLESVSAAALISNASLNSSRNMLEGNFVSQTFEESAEISSLKKSFAVGVQMQHQFSNRMNSLLDSLGGIHGPTLYTEPGSKGGALPDAVYDQMTRRIKNIEAQESSQRNLDELKEDIAQKADEAATPKDENGDPIETLSPDGVQAGEAVDGGSTEIVLPDSSGGTVAAVEVATPSPAQAEGATASVDAALAAYADAVAADVVAPTIALTA